MKIKPLDNDDRLFAAADLLLAVLNSRAGQCSLVTLPLDEVVRKTPAGIKPFTREEVQAARALLFRLGFGGAADAAA